MSGAGSQGGGGGTVSPTDILTTLKNLVQAINQAAQSYLQVQGIANSPAIAAATLVKVGAGRVATVSITTAGSAVGAIYDANALGVTTGQLYAIPNTLGVVHLNLPAQYGILVVPGTGQVVAVGYS